MRVPRDSFESQSVFFDPKNDTVPRPPEQKKHTRRRLRETRSRLAIPAIIKRVPREFRQM